MKTTICILVATFLKLTFFSSVVSAQVIHYQEGYQILYDIGLGKQVKYRFESDSVALLGNPFLFEDLIEGVYVRKDGMVYDKVYFNIYPPKNELFIRKGEDGYINRVELSKLDFVESHSEPCRKFRAFQRNGNWVLMEVIQEREGALILAEHFKTPDQSKSSNPNYRGPKKLVFVSDVDYYQLQGENWKMIPDGKKGLKWLSGEHWEKGKQYSHLPKGRKIKPEDLKQYLSYIQ